MRTMAKNNMMYTTRRVYVLMERNKTCRGYSSMAVEQNDRTHCIPVIRKGSQISLTACSIVEIKMLGCQTHAFNGMKGTHLNGQTQGVDDDQDKHDVLKACRVDHIPELVLVRVFWDVAPQRTSFESIFHTLTLWWWANRETHSPSRGT